MNGDGSPDYEEDYRFHCPHSGCNRSFVELWRLKVHYRAPSDVRGSGKERGHGAELPICPRCKQTLNVPGGHHTNCIVACSKRKVPWKPGPLDTKRVNRGQQSSTATEIEHEEDNLHMLAACSADGMLDGEVSM